MHIRTKSKLERKIFIASLFSCMVLGLIALTLGINRYRRVLTLQYIRASCNTAHEASVAVEEALDVEDIAKEVMRAYKNARRQSFSVADADVYDDRISGIENSEDYKQLISLLDAFVRYGDIYAVTLSVFDADNNMVVYIADPDPDISNRMRPADSEPVPADMVKTFLNWNGEGNRYYIRRWNRYGWLCTAGVPVLNAKGEVCAFVLADTTINDVIAGVLGYAALITVPTLLAALAIAYLYARRMRDMVVKPINAIAEASQAYVRDRRSGVSGGNHFAGLHIRTGDEVENLSAAMVEMERELTEFEESLTSVTAENERISTELNLAQRIQADMLPNVYPPFPDRTDLNIYASMHPAKEVGGDFYDFFLLDSDHLGMVVADVSGKGVPAALFMMISKILVQNYTRTGMSPKDILEKVNMEICANNHEDMFVTIWLGILDMKSGHMTASNAGHEFPVIRQAAGDFEVFKDPHGFVIGGLEGMKYKNYELVLERGARLFVYSDGVPEATNEEGEMFGLQRLTDVLNSVRDSGPQEILEKVRLEINAFVGAAPQFDDITMMCLEYLGPKHPVKERVFTANVDSISDVSEFVDAELEAIGCPLKIQMQLNLSIDEIFSNIARFAYVGENGKAIVRFEALENPRAVMLTFIDSGIAYNPLEAPEPDVTSSAAERQVGGLGIFLVRRLMDKVTYEHVDGSNILSITKILETADSEQLSKEDEKI